MIAVPAGPRPTHAVAERTGWPVSLSLVPLGCAVLMMLGTFVMEGSGPNVVAYVKLAIRVGTAGLLSLLLLTRLRTPAGKRILWFLPLVAFVAWGGVTILWSALPRISTFQLASFGSLVALAAAFATSATTPKSRSHVLAGVSVCLTLLGLGLVLLRVVAPGSGSMTRDGLGLLHATNTASTASLGLLIAVGSLLLFDWSWPRWLCPLAVPVHVVVLLVSANRTALALTTLLIGLLLLARGHRFALALGLAAVGAVGALALAVDPGFEIARDVTPGVESFLSRGQSTDQLAALSGREEMWEVMWDSYLESPWVGHGYFVSSASGSLEVWFDEGNFTAHNLVLQALVTTGLLGLVLLVVGVGLPYAYAASAGLRRVDGWRWSLLLGVLAVWYVGWGLLNESILGPLQPECVVFFTLLGLGVAAAADASPRRGVTA